MKLPISPVATDLIKPLIVIPSIELSETEKHFILEHESSHINSFDLWIGYFYKFLTAIYLWNPVIWYLRKHYDKTIGFGG